MPLTGTRSRSRGKRPLVLHVGDRLSGFFADEGWFKGKVIEVTQTLTNKTSVMVRAHRVSAGPDEISVLKNAACMRTPRASVATVRWTRPGAL